MQESIVLWFLVSQRDPKKVGVDVVTPFGVHVQVGVLSSGMSIKEMVQGGKEALATVRQQLSNGCAVWPSPPEEPDALILRFSWDPGVPMVLFQVEVVGKGEVEPIETWKSLGVLL